MNVDNLIINYSIAILELYHVNKRLLNDFILIRNIFESNLGLLDILSSDNLSKKERIVIIDKIFSSDIYYFENFVINFLKVLIENKHFYLLLKILLNFQIKINKENNITFVLIKSAFEIDKNQIDNILIFLIKKLKSKIDYKIVIDTSLIGGFQVLYDSNVIDFSIKGKIEHIKSTSKEKSIL